MDPASTEGTASILSGFSLIVLLYYAVIAVAHIMLAVALFNDGQRLERKGQQTVLVNPMIWALLGLAGGILTGGVYWVIHYSNLRRDS